MKKIFYCLLVTFIWSCGNGDVTDKIAQLEQAHAETPTTEVKKELLGFYMAHLKNLGNDANAFTDISQKTATLQMDLNQYGEAASSLTTAIQNHSSGNANTSNIRLLSSCLVNHVHGSNFQSAVDAIQKVFPDPASLKQKFQPILTNLAGSMLDEKTAKWDLPKVRDFISMSRLQAGVIKKDDEVQKSLFDAANIANHTKKFDKALQIYDYVLAHPDDFSKAPAALFLKGFTYDEHLKNFDEARKIYTEFLEKYPEDGYAASVQASLKNLGKSAEEIIQSFEK